jgi:hypothetical protein
MAFNAEKNIVPLPSMQTSKWFQNIPSITGPSLPLALPVQFRSRSAATIWLISSHAHLILLLSIIRQTSNFSSGSSARDTERLKRERAIERRTVEEKEVKIKSHFLFFFSRINLLKLIYRKCLITYILFSFSLSRALFSFSLTRWIQSISI